MIPQIGIAEMIVLLLVALVVVGPKDLPKLTRKLGQGVGQLRLMASQFTRAFEDMGAEAELAELRAELISLKEEGKLDKDLEEEFGDIRDILDDKPNPKAALQSDEPTDNAGDTADKVEKS